MGSLNFESHLPVAVLLDVIRRVDLATQRLFPLRHIASDQDVRLVQRRTIQAALFGTPGNGQAGNVRSVGRGRNKNFHRQLGRHRGRADVNDGLQERRHAQRGQDGGLLELDRRHVLLGS